MSDKDPLMNEILTKPTKLSQEQSVAVITKAKSTRIIAGAGAGKTEVLTRRIVYLLLVKEITPSSIVAFTFTEKAAANMKNRIYDRVEQLGGQKATANLGEMYIGTIDAYAKHLLEDKFGMGNYDILDENQERAYVQRHGWSFGLKEYGMSYPKICREFAETAKMVWAEMIPYENLRERVPNFYYKMRKYEDYLQKDRRFTFGKMIHSLVIKLREKPEAIENVKCLLIDEYQDINTAQAELIKIIGKSADMLFVVGDPRQSIYQWRGSNELFFHTFASTFPNSELFSINENRRSLQQIVKLANYFADTFVSRRYEHLNAIKPEDGFIALSQHKDKDSEAEWVVQQIESLFESNRDVRYSDFAILLRSTITSAFPFQQALNAHRVPFIIGGKVGLFRRNEAQALGRIFAWLSEKCFWDNGTWAQRGWVQGNDLLRTGLEYWTRVSNIHDIAKDVVSDKLKTLKKELQVPKPRFKNLTEVFYDVLNILGYQELDPSKPEDNVIMANLGRFHKLLTDYEVANRLGGRSIKWKQDLNGLCWFMNTYATQAYDEQPSDDIRTVNAVQIMTIHQAKGLEWPVVFVPTLVEGTFPTSKVGSVDNKKFWCNIPRDMFDVERYEGTEEDERRVFYVAITRAKSILVLSYSGDMINSSSFVKNLDRRIFSWLANGGHLPRNLIINPSSDSDSEMQSFSAREIITYEICPQLYRFSELWSYRPALREEMGYGNGLHFCLRRASELVKSGELTPSGAMMLSVNREFHMAFVGGSVLENFKRSASKVLNEFATRFGDDLRRVQEVEYRIEFPIRDPPTRATIMGRVDVIIKNKDEVEVRDYKTSEDARSFEHAGEQIKLYTLGLKRMGRLVTSGSIAYLQGPEIRDVDLNEKALQECQNKAINLIEEIYSRNFQAKPSIFCSQCDYAEICRWKNDSQKDKN